MSQENVGVVEAMGDAWNAGDMDAFRGFLAPDVIVRVPEGWPEPGPFVGREAVMRQWEQTARPGTPTRSKRSASVMRETELWRGSSGEVRAVALSRTWGFTGVYTVRKGQVLYQESF
jgi:ketosteroid isomerase-like protein